MEFLLIILSSLLFSVSNFFPALFFLSWFAFIPLIYLTRYNDYSHSFVIALLIAFLNSLLSFYWLYEIIDKTLAMPFSFNIFILLLYFFISALPFAVWVVINKFLQPKYSYSPIIAALSWTVMEYFRYQFINLNPFNYFAYTQSSFSLITKYAAYGGIFLVSFITVLIASYLVKIYLRPSVKKFIPLLFIFLVLIIIPFFDNYQSLDKYKNIEIAVINAAENDNKFFKIEDEIKKINSLINQSESRYIFTPEKTLSFDLLRNNYYRDILAKNLKRDNKEFYLQLGSESAAADSYNSKILNSLFLVSNKFEIINRYSKSKNFLTEIKFIYKNEIINFLRNYFNLNKNPARAKKELKIIKTSELSFLNIVSSEIFSSLINFQAGKNNDFNVDLIINSAEEKEISAAAFKNLTLAAAVYRAAETNTPLIRVVNGGYSAYIDNRGKILKKKQINNNIEKFKIALTDKQSYYQKKPQKIIYFLTAAFLILVFIKILLLLKNKISSRN